MVKHSFTVGGIDMRERFGLIVEKFEDQLAPSLRPRKVEVPGRDGAHDFGAKYHNERLLVVHCAAPDMDSRDCEELAYIIMRKSQIVRWDKPDRYYVGRVYEPEIIERIAGKAKRFAIPFACNPFTIGKTISRSIPKAFTGADAYGGTARTPTYITIKNTGTTTIKGLYMTIRERSEQY